MLVLLGHTVHDQCHLGRKPFLSVQIVHLSASDFCLALNVFRSPGVNHNPSMSQNIKLKYIQNIKLKYISYTPKCLPFHFVFKCVGMSVKPFGCQWWWILGQKWYGFCPNWVFQPMRYFNVSPLRNHKYKEQWWLSIWSEVCEFKFQYQQMVTVWPLSKALNHHLLCSIISLPDE